LTIEKFTGKLDSRSGTFVLQHEGQARYEPLRRRRHRELAGISGRMQIINDTGQHSYGFDYTLP